MSWSLLLPLYVGFATVFQAGMNRVISRDWGLGPVTLLNSIVAVLLSLVLWWASRGSSLPEIFRDRGGFATFQWWYWIPGFMGVCIVAGIPLAIARIGALQTFVVLIGAQIVASMFWDAMYESRPVTAVRVVGAVMAFMAAALVNLKG